VIGGSDLNERTLALKIGQSPADGVVVAMIPKRTKVTACTAVHHKLNGLTVKSSAEMT
jgi:ribosomal protein L34E